MSRRLDSIRKGGVEFIWTLPMRPPDRCGGEFHEAGLVDFRTRRPSTVVLEAAVDAVEVALGADVELLGGHAAFLGQDVRERHRVAG